ncbi:hypothetical protein DFP73DRAFT_526137 [Morchella snyderi]|nr:hypothetical protein DFP73DRAFT_526137 [Morchella snyderi]
MAAPIGVSIGDAILCTQIFYNLCKTYRDFSSDHEGLKDQLLTRDLELKRLNELLTTGSCEPLSEAQNRNRLESCNVLQSNVRNILDKYDPSQQISSKRKPIIMKARQMNVALSRKVIENTSPRQLFTPPPDHQPIQFIDALDRNVYVSLTWVSTWEGFHDHLKLYDELAKTIIPSEQWNATIKPGMVISMTMLVHVPSGVYEEGQRCPFCQSWGRRYSKKGRNICFGCRKWFPVAPVQFIQIGIIMDTVKFSVVENEFERSPSIPCWSAPKDNNHFLEIRALRRFNLIFYANTLIRGEKT